MQKTNKTIHYVHFEHAWLEKLVMIITFIIFLKPAWIGTLDSINRMWMLAQGAALIATGLIVSINRPSQHTWSIFLIFGLFMVSTIVNQESILHTVREITSYVGMALICDIWMRSGRARQMLSALSLVLMSYVYINFATVILMPEGLYTAVTSDGVSWVKCWFLGYKNPQIRVLLPALVILAVNKWNGRKSVLSLHFVIASVVVLATVVIVDSVTSVLATLGFVFLLLLFKNGRSRILMLLTPRNIILLFLLVTGFIVVFQKYTVIGEALSIFFPNRNVSTLSARTYVWNSAIEVIRKNWLIGQGQTWFVTSIGWKASHPHNYVLYYWMYGGIVAMLGMLKIWYDTLKCVHVQRTTFVGRVFLATIIVVFVMGIVEAPTEFPMIYALTAIACNLNVLGDGEMERMRPIARVRNLRIIW